MVSLLKTSPDYQSNTLSSRWGRKFKGLRFFYFFFSFFFFGKLYLIFSVVAIISKAHVTCKNKLMCTSSACAVIRIQRPSQFIERKRIYNVFKIPVPPT